MKENKDSSKLNKGLETLSIYNVAFVVSDINKAIEWYNTVLGFELIMKEKLNSDSGELEMAFMQGAGIKIELLQSSTSEDVQAIAELSKIDGPLSIVGSKALVFKVEDLKIASEELEQKGVEFLWRERYLAEDSLLCSMIFDMDGNRINIFQENTVG